MSDEGVSLTDEYIAGLIEEAARHYTRHQSSGPRGQLMMPSDGLGWWIVRTTWAAAREELTALRAENERLKEALNIRSKQIGVACKKHDLTHVLACGRCHEALRARVQELEAERNLLPHMPISGAMRREWERYMLRPFDSAAEDAFRAMLRAALTEKPR